MTDIPPDLEHRWQEVARDLFSICRRCQGMARRQEGIAAIRLLVFVNRNGAPVAWTDPKMTLLEPKNRVSEETLRLLIKWAEEMDIDLGDVLARS